MINLTQQLPWPRTLFLLLPLGFLPSFLLFLEAGYTTVTLNVSWCNHTVARRNGVWQNIVHVQKTYVHKPCIFCGHIWKGATYSIWEVHFNLFVIESHYTLVHRVESVENYALCMRWCLLWRRKLARILDVRRVEECQIVGKRFSIRNKVHSHSHITKRHSSSPIENCFPTIRHSSVVLVCGQLLQIVPLNLPLQVAHS